jgi:hypothetical protein
MHAFAAMNDIQKTFIGGMASGVEMTSRMTERADGGWLEGRARKAKGFAGLARRQPGLDAHRPDPLL